MLKVRLALVLGTLLLAAAAGILSAIAWMTAPSTSGSISTRADGMAYVFAWDFATGHTPEFPAGVPAAATSKEWGAETAALGGMLGNPIQRQVQTSTVNGHTIEAHEYYVAFSRDGHDTAYIISVKIDISTSNFALAERPTIGQLPNSSW